MPRSLVRVVVPALTLLAVGALAGCADEDPNAGTVAPAEDRTTTSFASPSSGVTTGASADLASVAADVERMAPALESYYRSNDAYPRDLAGALASLGDAGVAPSGGNTVGSYVYDADAVEFTLCVEAPGGAWATYDTSPMSVRDGGESGGCPAA